MSRPRSIYLLLAAALIAGLFLFRDYGLTWDEPLFYKYADALGYAYTPSNWFGGHFDLNLSYGPSGDDHKTRGPGYLLLARGPVYALTSMGVATTDAWHLVNFLTFLVGVYFVFRLASMFARESAALAATALFAVQPLLWGHAFINPKDIPFMVLLTGAIWLGLRMVDGFADAGNETRATSFARIMLPAIFLGLATANRVLGPLAAVLVLAYFAIRRPSLRPALWMLLYLALAGLVTIACWPYLWESPTRFVDVFRFMADNPTVLPVLFADTVYRANDLPRRYLPFFLTATLTEPVWPIFAVGLFTVALRRRQLGRRFVLATLILAWFLVPVAYAVAVRPSMYDGMRHFLFVLPPVFIIGAFGLDVLFEAIRARLANLVLGLLILVPGAAGIAQLHPYEYAYFNAIVGGTGGAFRHYETDYWLTCYKEAVQEFGRSMPDQVRLFVHREADVAQPYASANVTILDERGAAASVHPGDFVLVNTRTNEDLHTFRDAPEFLEVSRAGATFCVIKSLP